ncbi:MAG TPA: GAF and ANTAR domain-containing protein [Pseudonocardia sp.]|jgi:transcriptional regulator with GAF, ATPase, and Fis domain|nr:GAF and ANTAR domain-containing protein [Pseudonocardia sp.]
MNQPRGREQLLAEAFVSLADTLVDDYDVIDLLTRLIHYSVGLMDADAGGIMLADASGVLRVVATSDEDARLIELLQLQNDQGPCLEAYRTASAVKVSNLEEAGARWPLFVEAALRRPVFHAVHAVPLRLRGTAIGALNLWHYEPHTLPKEELALGQALADVATIAILQERAIRRGEVVNEQLQAALTSRVIIEQAKGLLAQHAGLGMAEAFELMRRYARSHNERLAVVARALAERTIEPEAVVETSQRPPEA